MRETGRTVLADTRVRDKYLVPQCAVGVGGSHGAACGSEIFKTSSLLLLIIPPQVGQK